MSSITRLISIAGLIVACGSVQSRGLCTAAQVVQTVAGCPVGNGPCNIDEAIEIDPGSCTLDFALRAVTLSERMLVGPNAVTILAGSFEIVSAPGSPGFIDARGTGNQCLVRVFEPFWWFRHKHGGTSV